MQLGLRLSPSGASARVLSVRALSAPHLAAMLRYPGLLSIRPTAFNDLCREYLLPLNVDPGWEGFLDKYAVDVVIVQSVTSLGYALEQSGAWSTAFKGPHEAVYGRNN